MPDMGRRILRGLLSRVKGIREGALFLWLFWNCPAGGVKARGRCGNGDSGSAFLGTPRFRRVSPWRGRLRSLRLGAARP